MDDMFNDILFTQGDMEISDISEPLSNNTDIFDEDIYVEETHLQIAHIAELMRVNPEKLDVFLICFKKK